MFEVRCSPSVSILDPPFSILNPSTFPPLKRTTNAGAHSGCRSKKLNSRCAPRLAPIQASASRFDD
jgi:hypothetical protein